MPPVQVSGQVCLFPLVLGKAAVSAEKSRAHYLSHMDNACFTRKITGNSNVPLLHKIYITSLSSRDPLNAEFSNLIFKFIIHRNTTKPMLPPPRPQLHFMAFSYCRGTKATNKAAARACLNYDSFDKFFHRSISF